MNEETKEMLLAQIEKLIAYGSEQNTINPALLEYLTVDDLTSMRNNLMEKAGTLKEEDKAWLEQFKKYE
ncbi:MAG: hypothetical protein IE918_01630 [Campylobacterales bacterium]|nr:hypothetical protein [Campylobacterales bacterium]